MRLTLGLEGWNARQAGDDRLLERTLRSLSRQTLALNRVEVIVVVDTDSPGQAEAVRRLVPGAVVLREADSTYYGAKNRVLDQASGDLVIFADSDVEYASDWLERLIAAFERSGIDFVVGNTLFQEGFLSGALNFSDWAALQPASGPTDFFYANNFALRREGCRTFRLLDRVGPVHGGAEHMLRSWFAQHRIRPWFCKEALAYHHYYPFLRERLYVGAYNMNVRRLARPRRPNRLDIPVLAPAAVIAGTALRSWARLWRCRAELPHRAWSLPRYAAALALSKSVELAGAVAYELAPGPITRRTGWFFRQARLP
jgi:glycosyltransferase involved in cell wall biosynthesis